MGGFDVRNEIRKIIFLEREDIEKNSKEIESISLDAIEIIKNDNLDVRQDFYHFLDDFDIRRCDELYRRSQTKRVEKYL